MRCWWGERSWIGTRCVVLLDGREVDRRDRNMAKLLAKSDEQDRDTVRTGEVDGNTVALLVGRAELDKDTVRGAAGWERSGEHGGSTG